MNADLELVNLLGTFHPVDVALGFHPVLFVRNPVHGRDHIVGVERLAIVERHTLAKIEFKGFVINPFPVRRQISLILAGIRIAIHQPIPDGALQNNAFTRRVEITVDIFKLFGECDIEGIVCFVGSSCSSSGHDEGKDSSPLKDLFHYSLLICVPYFTVFAARHIRCI